MDAVAVRDIWQNVKSRITLSLAHPNSGKLEFPQICVSHATGNQHKVRLFSEEIQ